MTEPGYPRSGSAKEVPVGAAVRHPLTSFYSQHNVERYGVDLRLISGDDNATRTIQRRG